MRLMSTLIRGANPVFCMLLWAAALLFVPAILALAFTLLGFELDWSTWKTYAGLLLISLALLVT